MSYQMERCGNCGRNILHMHGNMKESYRDVGIIFFDQLHKADEGDDGFCVCVWLL